jgi:predicted nuclease with TOPRIM domain
MGKKNDALEKLQSEAEKLRGRLESVQSETEKLKARSTQRHTSDSDFEDILDVLFDSPL